MTPPARSRAPGESIFLLFSWGAQIFSTISTAFLNPSHGETQSAAYSAFLGEQGDSSGVSLLFPPSAGLRNGGGKRREQNAAYRGRRLLWWLGMKDDIARSVVVWCHRPY